MHNGGVDGGRSRSPGFTVTVGWCGQEYLIVVLVIIIVVDANSQEEEEGDDVHKCVPFPAGAGEEMIIIVPAYFNFYYLYM